MCNNNRTVQKETQNVLIQICILTDCMYLRCWSNVNVRRYKCMIIIIIIIIITLINKNAQNHLSLTKVNKFKLLLASSPL